LLAAGRQQLDGVEVHYDERVACTVMAVSGGYPGDYEKGKVISGLDLPVPEGSLVFHAGTAVEQGALVTNGGRVLCVTSFGDTISDAVKRSGAVLENIRYEGINYRKDIGYEFK